MQSEDRTDPRATGGCLCGAVRYEVHGKLRGVVNCHCGQCLRTHGGPAPYSSALKSDLLFTEAGGLKWYDSSEHARRGFCSVCGASLFWEPSASDSVAIAGGSLDQPSGLKTIGHIFVSDKPDFYEITDGLPQRPRGHAD